jgi:NAD-dependent dihydropyrimidine dehydrogenase PreA subunit
VIEFIVDDICNGCNKCVEVCPTDALDFAVAGGTPIIARQVDCTSCMNCELYCPTDAIYVSPLKDPDVDLDHGAVIASGILGSYRKALHWENGHGPQGTGDNWALQLRDRQGERAPPAHDKIRNMLYEVRDRNLI